MQQSLNDIWQMADYTQQIHRTINQKINRPNGTFPRNLLSLLNEYVHYSIWLSTCIQEGAAFGGKNCQVMCPEKALRSLYAHADDQPNIKENKY